MADYPELARARGALRVSADDQARVDALSAAASASLSSSPSDHLSRSYFEGFALRGVRVLSIHRGFIHCSYTVLPSLTDSTTGCLAAGVVVALVDEIGSAAAISDSQNLKVSVDMSVAFLDLSQARPGDKLSIKARALGYKGAYSGTHVLLTNAYTGDVVAEGRHSTLRQHEETTTQANHFSQEQNVIHYSGTVSACILLALIYQHLAKSTCQK